MHTLAQKTVKKWHWGLRSKLNLRNGLFKVLGEFSLRENLYYGSIFFCMTLIVIVCFVVINNRGGDGVGEDGLGIGSASKMFDDGKEIIRYPNV